MEKFSWTVKFSCILYFVSCFLFYLKVHFPIVYVWFCRIDGNPEKLGSFILVIALVNIYHFWIIIRFSLIWFQNRRKLLNHRQFRNHFGSIFFTWFFEHNFTIVLHTSPVRLFFKGFFKMPEPVNTSVKFTSLQELNAAAEADILKKYASTPKYVNSIACFD